MGAWEKEPGEQFDDGTLKTQRRTVKQGIVTPSLKEIAQRSVRLSGIHLNTVPVKAAKFDRDKGDERDINRVQSLTFNVHNCCHCEAEAQAEAISGP